MKIVKIGLSPENPLMFSPNTGRLNLHNAPFLTVNGGIGIVLRVWLGTENALAALLRVMIF
jgi:hypothetical protein